MIDILSLKQQKIIKILKPHNKLQQLLIYYTIITDTQF